MSRQPFRFKQFSIRDDRSAMKINTDGVLLGAWTRLPESGTALDIGTGCGIIALMLAQKSNLNIDAIDIHKDSIEEARENFEQSPWHDRLHSYPDSLQDFVKRSSKKYDLIICNPPFFSKSLLSASNDKNLVRHDQMLPLPDLVLGAEMLLNEAGIFSVILPVHRYREWSLIVEGHGFYCSRKTAVIPKKGKNINRFLLEYVKAKPSHTEETALTLMEPDNQWSDAYKNLAQAFYLQC